MSLWQKITQCSLLGALFVAICLGWYSSVLSGRLDKSQEANGELVKAIESRDETIGVLKGAADADRHATEEQLKIEQQKRAKADAENKTLRKALESSDCDRQPLPADALRILRREDKAPAST